MEYCSAEVLRSVKTHFYVLIGVEGVKQVLSSSTLVKPLLSQTPLSFSIANVDELFPGFVAGDFAVLYGMRTVLPLSLLLTVRAQLPAQLCGLETNVVFVDGGNSFRLYEVSRIAQLHQLDPRKVLERIFISRAFTAHQMTTIILDKLKEAVDKYKSKLVIISDITGLYLDKDIWKEEAEALFNHVTQSLARFAEENKATVLATCLPHYPSPRTPYLREAVCGRANVVISMRQAKYGQQFVLEKHPTLCLGYAEFPSDHVTIDQFTE